MKASKASATIDFLLPWAILAVVLLDALRGDWIPLGVAALITVLFAVSTRLPRRTRWRLRVAALALGILTMALVAGYSVWQLVEQHASLEESGLIWFVAAFSGLAMALLILSVLRFRKCIGEPDDESSAASDIAQSVTRLPPP